MLDKSEQDIIKSWKGDLSKPVVSICTITYNHKNYIVEAIDSFLMQETDFPFEIVIGEDCSTDGTRIIINSYVEKYSNIIRLVTSECNVGMHKNFIRTVKKCQGKYIALCEGDDYWTDSLKLQIQIDEMKKYPELGFSFHLASTLNNFNVEINPKLQNKNKIYSLKEIITADFHLIQSNTIIIKKEKIDNLNYDLLSKSPVGDVWIRVNAAMPNGVIFINRIMSTYRLQSEGSWSSSMSDHNKFINYIYSMIDSIDNFDEYWNFRYTNEFLIYKNMYIDTVMKKKINQNIKNDFIRKNKASLSIKNLIQWNMLYKYPSLVNYLKLFKNTMKGLLFVKRNTK